MSGHAIHLRHASASGSDLSNRWELGEDGYVLLAVKLTSNVRDVCIDLAVASHLRPRTGAIAMVRIDATTWRLMPARWAKEDDRWTTKACLYDERLPPDPIVLTHADDAACEALRRL